jgi:hypothetical protein
MNILNELLILAEAKEKNLIGLTIGGKKITEKTPSEHWAGNFDCSTNHISIIKGFSDQITSLKGAPASVSGDFDCYSNNITSLEGAPSSVDGDFNCGRNNLSSLKGIEKILKKMNGTFFAQQNPLKSHVIGLLLVPGCKEVRLDNNQVQEILNKHLKSPFGNKRVIDCQSELLDANLDEFAKL